ncbi:hypothetical protein TNCV_3613401 [Trichonephila clavipes]|uniref:Uncharacterized protein n=1 Tax=Trichonephila clavipes TaxID=2585209 RepID=A0A8X6STJ2_TRICX|nr:hypothetical protein TNCV_3613401 [Trichonephila clavipes]
MTGKTRKSKDREVKSHDTTHDDLTCSLIQSGIGLQVILQTIYKCRVKMNLQTLFEYCAFNTEASVTPSIVVPNMSDMESYGLAEHSV